MDGVCRFIGILVLALLLGACAGSKPYQISHNGPSPCYHAAARDHPACVRFVEYDDFGNVFKRAQLDETLVAARAVAQRNGIIVVYVHGWEHNAGSSDSDLAAFQGAMENAQALSRHEVLGIYVGWRGKSLLVPGLSKATFWERKTTAQAIGDGAVFELLRTLANERERHRASRLVLIGHSFGAAVLYASVFHSITSQLIDDPLDASEAARAGPDAAKRWDMVVLVNPAFEAMQLRPHFELAGARTFIPAQLPHLILITTQADWATGMAFPAGRYFRSIFNKYADATSASQYRSAVGHYLPYVTHQLAAVQSCTPYRQEPMAPLANVDAGAVVNRQVKCYGAPRERAGAQDVPVLLTRCDRAGDCTAVAGQHSLQAPPNMPIWNIRTTGDVMRGHSDIWNPTMHAFLVRLMLSMPGAPVVAPSKNNAQTVQAPSAYTQSPSR